MSFDIIAEINLGVGGIDHRSRAAAPRPGQKRQKRAFIEPPAGVEGGRAKSIAQHAANAWPNQKHELRQHLAENTHRMLPYYKLAPRSNPPIVVHKSA